MIPKVNPTKTNSWKKLIDHFDEIGQTHLVELFKNDQSRGEYLTFEFEEFFFDLSKNHLSKETISLFKDLYNDLELEKGKRAMKTGEPINETEKRAVLHTALRNLSGDPILVQGKDVMPDVLRALDKIKSFTKRLHNRELIGYSGKPINTIVNIGIGGSDLGPYMVCSALKPHWITGFQTHFVSNVDASQLLQILEQVNPETTLFIIASKTFTTQETMTNASTARDWFLEYAKDPDYIKNHFVAVSTNSDKVSEFGIDPNNMFEFWDWVGGRYSLWSSIGLSIACSVGYQKFEELLKGAEAMDHHFFNAPFEENIPTLLAFIGVWYNNFFGCETHAVLPYDHLLSHFSSYLQQADMESNGKHTDRNRESVKYQTGPIVWGEPGTNGQHAFYQLIHKGTKLIPCDFIAAGKPAHDKQDHHDKLIANFIAQPEALMWGKKETQVVDELRADNVSDEDINSVLPYKTFAGNKPTNTILMKELSPKNLGTLIALYEHKIFIQGLIWNIYSFDQWGVELGKQLAGTVLKEIKEGKAQKNKHDASTANLINKYLSFTKG